MATTYSAWVEDTFLICAKAPSAMRCSAVAVLAERKKNVEGRRGNILRYNFLFNGLIT